MPKREDKINKDFDIKIEYSSAFKYIKESKNFIYASILIFSIFMALGFFFQDLINLIFLNLGLNLNDMIRDFIRELLKSTQGMNQKELIGFIFINNLQSSITSMIFGLFFGIVPLISSFTNGYLLGFVALSSVKAEGFLTLFKILPHRIFELPAIFISFGLGFRLGSFSFNKERKPLLLHLKECLRVFILIIIPLLIVAAFIEGSLIALAS